MDFTPTNAGFPFKLQVLFLPKRYKVLWGGRAAGRSWGVARALLLLGLNKPLRILCAREFQNSITESVHKVIADQVSLLGLDAFYDIQKQGIYGRGPAAGTSFSFEGIKNNINRIKSYEGIDICWVEEAVKVSKNSWDVLVPTIRKPGSEIWMTFNPELDEDYTYKRFVKQAAQGESGDSVVVHMTYLDNPFVNDTLLDEIRREKERDYDSWDNIWMGRTRQILDGVVYAKELRRAQAEGRIGRVKWDREFPVNVSWDLGKRDLTALWFYQNVAREFRFIDYYEARGEEIPHFLKEMQKKEYVYGEMALPHDAFAKRLGMSLTIAKQIARPGYGVWEVPKLPLVQGINVARTILSNCFFDEENCADGLHALRHYKYKVLDGQYSEEPLHDDSSNGADSFRYAAIELKRPQKGMKGVLAKLGEVRDMALAERKLGMEGGRRASGSSDGWMG